MERDQILAQIDEALRRHEALVAPRKATNGNPPRVGVLTVGPQRLPPAPGNMLEAELVVAETIRRFAPPGSSYARVLADAGGGRLLTMNPEGTASLRLKVLVPALRGLRFEFASERMGTFTELVHADVFREELMQARGLLEARYVKAAAVVAGVVLEAHLRKLAEKLIIPLRNDKGKFVHAERLNEDLAKKGAFDPGEQKLVVHWLDLRDAGAHPDDDTELTPARVDELIEGVKLFIERHPA